MTTKKITTLKDLKSLGAAIRERILIELGNSHPNEPPDEHIAIQKINENPYVLLTIPGIGMHRITTILQDNYGILMPEIPTDITKNRNDKPQAIETPLFPPATNTQTTPRTPPTTTAPPDTQNTLTPAPNATPATANIPTAEPNTTAPKPTQDRGVNYLTYPGIGPTLANRIETTLSDYYTKELERHVTKLDLDYLIELNPYRLTLVPGIGFLKADRIATQIYDVQPNDSRRHTHANRHLLQQNNGVMPINAYRRARHEFGLHDTTQETNGVEIDLGHVWEPNELHAERILATWCVDNCQTPDPIPPVPEHIQEETRKYHLNPEQTQAVWAAMNHQAMALTGGAGTGKTTTIAALADILSRRGQNVHLMAFAGKGSDRIAEALKEHNIQIDTKGPFGEIDHPTRNNDNDDEQGNAYRPRTDTLNRYYGRIFVSTIHRGLAADGAGYFRMNDLAADLVIIDEASMLPNKLITSVIERMHADARLLLVGDPHQLPPIEYGAPFETLINIGLPHHHLTQNYRQANQQAIHQLAENIRTQTPKPLTNQNGRTIHTSIPDQNTYDQTLIQTIQTHTQNLPIQEWQIVTATNATRHHTNTIIQNTINPKGIILGYYQEHNQKQGTPIRQGDKLVIIRNDYEFNIFNGQSAIAIDLDRQTDGIIIEINNKRITIPKDLTRDILRLGYAITTHKSQGTGWNTVIIAEPNRIPNNPNRWMYTSVTRASQHIIILTTHNEQQWWQNTLSNPPINTGTLQHRINKIRSQQQNTHQNPPARPQVAV